jgi:RNA polymerase sigma factor (sigma-70 family)
MMTIEGMQTAELNDAELVAESLSGNRDAFRQIVERHQTLISSLAYCATGNLSQSEDLAQETFVTAWKKLAELREPAKLRSWLCSITRFLISKEFRRQGREPIHQAESLDAVDDRASTDPLPTDHAISEEEKAILWRSLERIPEIYREPLVLFYREHQSIETVARDLELSEDAVKQRLSRGRKLLQEQLLAFVAGALKQTSPGKTFTLGVMAMLPLLAASAKAATVTAAAGKGSSAAKAAAGGGTLSAFLSAGVMMLFSLFGVFGLAGRWLGRKMGLASRESPWGRKRIMQFWRTLGLGFLVFVVPPMFITPSLLHSKPWLFRASTWSLTAFFWLVAAALVIWIWQRRLDRRRQQPEAMEITQPSNKSYNLWVTLGMTGPAYIFGSFVVAIFFSDWVLATKSVPEAEAQQLIAERTDARFTVYQYRDGSKSLWIALPDNRRISLSTAMNDSLLAKLTEKGITYSTRVEDQDFHNGGVQGWLVLLCTFISVAGAVLLLRRPGTKRFYQQEVATPRAERREKRIFAVCVALAMLATSLLLVSFTIAHGAPKILGTEVAKIILEHKNARYEVFQYSNGSKELWISPLGCRRYPGFIAPADESTLAFLAANRLSYETKVQGRDFGFRGPGRIVSLTGSFVLAAFSIGLLWWVMKKPVLIPTVAESHV